jgi:hypothetical protein
MIKKTLGNWVPRALANRLARIAPLVRQLVFARVTITVLMIPSGVAADSAQPPVSVPPLSSPRSTAARISDPTARAVELDLGGVFLTQKDTGAYAFSDAHAGVAALPLMASMSLDAYYTTGNKSTLSQAAYSVGRYYTYLLGAQDRDGDRLIESAAPWGGKDARAEDPAYNSLLAVDMRSLARANFELRRTLPALYWYDTSRTVAHAVVAGTFDGDACYFFPNDAATNRSVRQWSALASLAVVFDEFVGPNHADEVVTRHLMRWATDFAARGDDTEVGPTQRAVERLVGVAVMRATNHTAPADALRGLRVLSNATVESIALYATERAMIDRPLRDRDLAFDLLYAIVRSSQKFTDPEVVRIEKSLPDVRDLASGSPTVPLEVGEQSVRTIYTAVSQLRDKLRASSFFSAEDRAAFPGADATIATSRLLDDVSALLRRAENTLYVQRFGAAGLRIATQFPKDGAVVGEYAILNWELSSATKAFDINSVMAGVYGEVLAPVNAGKPFSVTPAAPKRFAARHLLKGNAGTLRLITYMITIEDAVGNRARYYVERSVYAHPPVGILARFPRGRVMDGARVPIELDMTRRARNSETTRYYWFSPAGLRLAEGNQGALAFGPEDSTAVTLNVEIPSPCRPGVFPFTLKFITGEREAGTIQASLFKPYQWAFLGPFAGGNLDKKFPPENGVALLNAYDAGKRKIQWAPVPASATGPRGDVVMRRLIDETGVSYLYTVVAVPYETDIGARLVSNCPAALFVNGKRVLVNTAAAGDSTTGNVHLHGDKNHILVKMVGDASATVAFGLGNDDNIAADEFNNDLAELVEGYQELLARSGASEEVPSEARRLVTFTYEDPAANAVSVVGSFNGWSPETHRLQRTAEGHWELTLSLAPGRYSYRFLIDQKKQVLDPSTALTEPDGYGGQNSVVVVNR